MKSDKVLVPTIVGMIQLLFLLFICTCWRGLLSFLFNSKVFSNTNVLPYSLALKFPLMYLQTVSCYVVTTSFKNC